MSTIKQIEGVSAIKNILSKQADKQMNTYLPCACFLE